MTSKNPWTAMAAALSTEQGWYLLADYCRARERNLRGDAAALAEQIVEDARNWPFEERKRFSLWLAKFAGSASERSGLSEYDWRFSTSGPGLFAPHRVVEGVLLPSFVEWCQVEPANAEPYFWLGLYGENPVPLLQQALSLDPTHDPARFVLVGIVIRGVEYAQHELPSGYIGEPADDLAELSEAKERVTQATASPLRDRMFEKIAALEANAQDWVRLRDQFRGLDWDVRLSIWQARPRGQLGAKAVN